MAAPVILVTGGYDHKIRYWDATTGACTRIVPFGDSQVNSLAISLDKSLLAAGGNSALQLYDINSNDERPILTYEGHSSNITALGFQRDQRWLYSCSEDSTVRIWDPRGNVTVRKYDAGSPVNSVCLHPSETELISGDQNGFLRVWDLAADKYREELMPAIDIPIRSVSIVSSIHASCFVSINPSLMSNYDCFSSLQTATWSVWDRIAVDSSSTRRQTTRYVHLLIYRLLRVMHVLNVIYYVYDLLDIGVGEGVASSRRLPVEVLDFERPEADRHHLRR